MKKTFLPLLVFSLLQFHTCLAQNTAEPLPGTIPSRMDTVLTAEIGGIQQVLEIKTDDASKPVLLFLSGGPGSSMMPAANKFTGILKNYFTLVQWDQRGAGKTLALNPSLNQPSVGQMEKDTYQVVRFLNMTLRKEKIYLAGSSWGNVLGFYMVENYPELLHAYFAVNPVVSQLQSEKELLKILKAYFTANLIASQELARVTIPFEKSEDLFYIRKWLFYKEGKQYVTSDEFKAGFLTWSETWSPVWNEVMQVDLPKTLKKVKCPVYFFVGKNDIQTSTPITQQYYQNLKAPKKGLLMFENSGHQIHKDEPEAMQNAMIRLVVPQK